MATIAGVVEGINLVKATPGNVSGTRKVFELTVKFGAYTGAADSATITGIPALIKASVDDGVSYTLRSAVCAYPGLDTNAQAIYTGALTVATNDLTFNLTIADGTEITTSTACTGVGIFVVVD